ncbi:MAG: metallophosphoesterase [Planctomycetes bacterium]|nr:metallophosphoesterase [Planctomycetota bacterium]
MGAFYKADLARAFIFSVIVLLVYFGAFRIVFRKFYLKRDIRHWGWIDRLIIGLAIAGVFCFTWGYFIEPNRIEVIHLTLKSDKIMMGNSIRLVHLSDLHIEEEGYRELTVPKLVERENPDLILLTGDYLNNHNSQEILRRFLEKLKTSSKFGVYAVAGNFDRWFPSHEVFKDLGIKLLDGESAALDIRGSRVIITETHYNINKQTGYKIYLCHYPDFIPEISRTGVDLYLCGHTHGGQIRMPLYGALMTFSRLGKRYEMGYYREGNMDAYVTRGIGLEPGILASARFLCPPEITVIDIEPK